MQNALPELLLAIYGTLVAPLVIVAGRRIDAWLKRRARRRELIRYLAGLPLDLKAVLAEYHAEGTHTRPGNPVEQAVMQLSDLGLLRRGTSSGAYAAVSSYLVLRADVFAVLDGLAHADPGFRSLSMKLLRDHIADAEADQRNGDQ